MKNHPFDTFMDKSLVQKELEKAMAESNFGQVEKLWRKEHYGSIEELLRQKEDYLKFAEFKQTGECQVASSDGTNNDILHNPSTSPSRHAHPIDYYNISEKVIANDKFKEEIQ